MYPRCAEGERARPPEDCGGPGGYEELLQVLSDSKRPERRLMIGWLKCHAKNYDPYRPAKFDPSEVEFMDPDE